MLSGIKSKQLSILSFIPLNSTYNKLKKYIYYIVDIIRSLFFVNMVIFLPTSWVKNKNYQIFYLNYKSYKFSNLENETIYACFKLSILFRMW